MITKINSVQDAFQALNENLEGTLTGKRKLMLAKEVTNNIGKHISIVKLQQVEKLRIGDKEPLKWFEIVKLLEKEKK